MAVALSPPPHKTPVTGPNGLLSQPWAAWFRDTFNRLGGSIAPDVKQLNQLLDETATQFEMQQAQLADLQTSFTNLSGSGLNNGPVL